MTILMIGLGLFVIFMVVRSFGVSSSRTDIASEALDFTELPEVEGRYTLHISGEQYDGRQSAIWRLRSGQRLLLRREPWNKYDPQAVAVSTVSGDVVGYIPRKNVGWVSRLIDEGEPLRASVAHLFDDDGDSVIDVQIHIDGVPPVARKSKARKRRLIGS